MRMANKYRNKVFGIIYYNIKKKHPDWSQRQIIATTVWFLRKNTK